MNGYKRAALQFLELEDGDRQWLLNKLSPQERQKILAIMSQFDEENRNGDSMPPPAMNGSHNGYPAQPSDPLAAHIAAINAAGVKEVLAILSVEPDWLIASVLGFKQWSWTRGFCDELSVERRAQVLHAAKYTHEKIKPKTREAIIEALADQIKKAKPKSANGHGYASFESLLQAMETNPGVEKRPAWRSIWIR